MNDLLVTTMLEQKDLYRISTIMFSEIIKKTKIMAEFGNRFVDKDLYEENFCVGFKRYFKGSRTVQPINGWVPGEKNKLYLTEFGLELFDKIKKPLVDILSHDNNYERVDVDFEEGKATIYVDNEQII